MNKILKFAKSIWLWFYERTVLWCIIGFFGLLSFGQLQKGEVCSHLSDEMKQQELDCKVSCLPSSSEYVFTPEQNQCWCYKDVNTLVKPQ